ncbi:MAG: hypothetical protein QM765_14905 [Myxococcales bacterium]
MRKFSFVVGLSALVIFMAGADGGGCFGGGSSSDPDAGGTVANYPRTCTGDSDCATTEVCHPIGLVCVKSCAGDSTVCGDESCVETTFNNKTVSICKCDTCKTGEVCSKDLDDVCETRCTSNTDCQAFLGQTRVCNSNGICEFSTSPCGAPCPANKVCDPIGAVCIDVCTATSCNTANHAKCNATSGLCEACSVDADCANVGTNLKCDKTSNPPSCVSKATTCNPANLAPGANKGPDTCNYGEVCDATTNSCTATVPDGTCVTGYAWNKLQFGPVITSVAGTSSATSNGTTECGNAGPKIEVVVEFYAPGGLNYVSFKDFLDPTAGAGCLGHLPFTKVDGNAATVTGASYIRGLPTTGETYGSFTAGLCTSNNVLGGRAVWIIDGDGSASNPACL